MNQDKALTKDPLFVLTGCDLGKHTDRKRESERIVWLSLHSNGTLPRYFGVIVGLLFRAPKVRRINAQDGRGKIVILAGKKVAIIDGKKWKISC